MTSYIRTVGQLIVLLLTPDPCSTKISAEVSKNNCPPKEHGLECTKGMKWEKHYANLISSRFRVNFLCDTQTDGGGWIVIQRRVHHDTDFYQKWDAYKRGFGTVCTDYWLGNKNIHKITTSGNYELWIDMMYQSIHYHAHYKDFHVSSEENSYSLHVAGFSGNTVDEMHHHNRMMFSTMDRDNDAWTQGHCARKYESGWWHNKCHFANLNGNFKSSNHFGRAVIWEYVTGNHNSLDSVEMKIRKRDS